MFYRLWRSVNKPNHYVKTTLIREVVKGEVEFSYKDKNRRIFENITVDDVEWLYGMLSRLSDKQMRDAFRAANYDQSQIETLMRDVKDKIAEMAQIVEDGSLALQR